MSYSKTPLMIKRTWTKCDFTVREEISTGNDVSAFSNFKIKKKKKKKKLLKSRSGQTLVEIL